MELSSSQQQTKLVVTEREENREAIHDSRTLLYLLGVGGIGML